MSPERVVRVGGRVSGERVVELSAGPLRVLDRGEGEPIVFLHGVLMNADSWRAVLPPLAERYRCLAPDWPTGGHRLPLRPSARLTPVTLADLVAELLDALALERVTLVGIGLGTLLCQMTAIRSPAWVARVVFGNGDIVAAFPPRWARVRFAAAYAPPLAALAARALRRPWVRRLAYARFAHHLDDGLAESFTRGVRTEPAIRRDTLKLLRGICLGGTDTDHERLREFRGRALVVWGEDDRAFPATHPDELARLLPGARVERVAGARTFLAQDRPDALAAAIIRFMEEGWCPRRPSAGR